MREIINKKYYIEALLTVSNANPNGDPESGAPRQFSNGHGYISDVAIKRKIRNRMEQLGYEICAKANIGTEKAQSIKTIIWSNPSISKCKDIDEMHNLICDKYMDARFFGLLVPQKNNGNSKIAENQTAIGIKGPVTCMIVESVDPIEIENMVITKTYNLNKDGPEKASDTFGMTKDFVRFGVYKLCLVISPYLALKTGFTNEDFDTLKEIIKTLFQNDESASRPAGSMNIKNAWYWEVNEQNIDYDGRNVFDSIVIKKKEGVNYPEYYGDYDIKINNIPGIKIEALI